MDGSFTGDLWDLKSRQYSRHVYTGMFWMVATLARSECKLVFDLFNIPTNKSILVTSTVHVWDNLWENRPHRLIVARTLD